jgi:hypothetical protein
MFGPPLSLGYHSQVPIIIVSYSTRELLGECLKSLFLGFNSEASLHPSQEQLQ